MGPKFNVLGEFMLNVWVRKLGVNELSYAAAPGQFFDSIQKERTFLQCRVFGVFLFIFWTFKR